MSNPDPKTDVAESDNGFFINAGMHTGWFKTPAGDITTSANLNHGK